MDKIKRKGAKYLLSDNCIFKSQSFNFVKIENLRFSCALKTNSMKFLIAPLRYML